MRNSLIILVTIFTSSLNSLEVLSQNTLPPASGEVSFVTSQNVYLRFTSTDNMVEGDTVYLSRDGIETPCIIIL